MKIKRFFAATMRAAINQVRAELGPDAVIVSSKRAEGGIEIIAAVDYDETLAQQTLAAHARPASVEPPAATATLQAPEPAPEPPRAMHAPAASKGQFSRDVSRRAAIEKVDGSSCAGQ